MVVLLLVNEETLGIDRVLLSLGKLRLQRYSQISEQIVDGPLPRGQKSLSESYTTGVRDVHIRTAVGRGSLQGGVSYWTSPMHDVRDTVGASCRRAELAKLMCEYSGVDGLLRSIECPLVSARTEKNTSLPHPKQDSSQTIADFLSLVGASQRCQLFR